MDKLERNFTKGMFLGVCEGLGEYTNVDPTFWRLAFVVLSFLQPFFVLAYFIFALVMPTKN